MRARTLGTAVLEPEQLTVLYKAFDDAWEIVKSQCAANPEVGRLRLANAILAAYRDGVTDLDTLRAAGVQLMQRWA